MLSVESSEGFEFPLILIIVAPFAIMMVSRAIVVYGGSTFLRIFRVRIPIKWQNVLTIGGIRGGIAVALVLSLTAEYHLLQNTNSRIYSLV